MKENVYPQVMYEALRNAQPKELYNSSYRESAREGESIMNGLVGIGYNSLVELILKSNVSPRILTETLDAYLQKGELQKYLDLLKVKIDQRHHFDMERYIQALVKQGDQSLLLSFLDYINHCNTHVSYYTSILEALWNRGQFDRAQLVISHIPEVMRSICFLIHRFHQGHILSVEEVVESIEETYMMMENNSGNHKIFNQLCGFVITQLDAGCVDIPILESAIVTYESLKKVSEYGIDIIETIKLYGKVRQYHCTRGEFKAVENFIEKCSDTPYYSEEIILSQLDYAIRTRDRTLHAESLNQYIEIKEKKLKEFKNAFDEPYLKKDWEKRFNFAEIQAHILCQKAIFELMHGDAITGKNLVEEMVTMAESIHVRSENTGDSDEDTTKHHQAHAKKVRLKLKKELKENFLQVGLLHILPSKNGWRDTIKDPNKREQDRDIGKKLRVKNEEIRKKGYNNELMKEEGKKTQYIHMMLLENKIDDAIQSLVEETEWISAKRGTWERGMLILDHRPESFEDLFRTLSKPYLREDDSYNDYASFAQFWAKGCQLGVVKESYWEELFTRVKRYRFHSGDSRILPHDFLVYLVKYCIECGNRERVWKFFESVLHLGRGDFISHETISSCLFYFIHAFTNHESRDGSYLAFINADIQEENNISPFEGIRYWNTKANMACMYMDDGEHVKSQEELKNTILNAEHPSALLRMWCRIMVQSHMRNPHQVKSEMTLLHSSLESSDMTQEDIRRIKRRIITTLMELCIPGMEASTEVKKVGTPERVQYLWFQKLLQKHYLSQGTERFLGDDWREHIPHLRRLLAQYQNEFNTVIETLNGSPFQSSEWKNVFTVLNMVGVMTPGIWSQAKFIQFDQQKLHELSEKIKSMRKSMFLNTPLPRELTRELQAELIYQAFKPANMSYGEVCALLGNFSDCTHHLNRYSFPQDGYLFNISQRQDVVLRNGEIADGVLDTLLSFLSNKNIGTEGEEKYTQNIGRSLCEVGRLKIEMFDTTIHTLLSLFTHDTFFSGIDSVGASHNHRFQYIQRLKDFFDLYLGDNLENRILSFFQNTSQHTSGMWESLIENLNIPKKRTVLENQLKIAVPDTIDENTSAHIIAQIILQKSKTLQKIKQSVNRELKKYVQITDGQEIVPSSIRLQVYVSKNQASFFAKASAGLCTHSDIRSFMRNDHFHFNLVDLAKQECVGNLMAYEIDLNGKKVLLLRGFNPNMPLLKSIDVPSYCEGIIDVAKQFALGNHFDALYMSENGEWHALSNRHEIVQYLMKRYGSFEKGESCNFPITGAKSISTIYPIANFHKTPESFS